MCESSLCHKTEGAMTRAMDLIMLLIEHRPLYDRAVGTCLSDHPAAGAGLKSETHDPTPPRVGVIVRTCLTNPHRPVSQNP